jgi:hypothetical protein
VRTNRRGGLAAATQDSVEMNQMAVMSGVATAAAKASAGIAVALASIGTAGAAGVLPDAAQDRFDTVVESVNSTEDPRPADENAEFGQRVSEDAQDGGVDGGEISEQARQQGDAHRPEQLPTPAAGQPAEPGRPAELPTPTDGPALQRPSPTPAAPGR